MMKPSLIDTQKFFNLFRRANFQIKHLLLICTILCLSVPAPMSENRLFIPFTTELSLADVRYIPVTSLSATKGTSFRYVGLKWDSCDEARGYLILRRKENKDWTLLKIVTRIQFNDTDALPGVGYDYHVYALIFEGPFSCLDFEAPKPVKLQDSGFKKDRQSKTIRA